MAATASRSKDAPRSRRVSALFPARPPASATAASTTSAAVSAPPGRHSRWMRLPAAGSASASRSASDRSRVDVSSNAAIARQPARLK